MFLVCSDDATRRQRPNISQADISRLMAHLSDARRLLIYYRISHGTGDAEKEAAEKAKVAIEGFATLITGDAEYFWPKRHSSGGS